MSRHRFCASSCVLLALLSISLAQVQEDPNAAACQTISYVVSVCERLTPGFTSFTNFNFQAPCLCYASSYWLPNGYDGWLHSCYAGYRTGNPQGYASLTSFNGGPPITTPCHSVGNILSSAEFTGPVTALVPPVTRPLITNPDELACATLNGAAAYCNTQSPGFYTLTNFRDQASCYCYEALVFNPTTFDSLWPSCVRFLSTASPSAYSTASANGAPVLTSTPCAAVGDVRDIRSGSSTGPVTITGWPSSTSTRSAFPTSTSVVPNLGARKADELSGQLWYWFWLLGVCLLLT
ncbi:hypothetical protein B0O99DRAFT_691738 [Bisporella sp. PMI_857]|nr:hypothetical protein B0O99DRAFT_691738 [Bisporella sp. PMI_857]